jgi:ABC-type Fe3+-siderophore transport system permease subunit
VKASDGLTARLGAILSVFFGLWGLAFAATPIGAIGGAGAALFGLAFGLLALHGHARGRWRKVALAGIAISILALAVFVVFILFAG